MTVMLVLAFLILGCGICVAFKKEWALPAFCLLTGVYCLIAQLPVGK